MSITEEHYDYIIVGAGSAGCALAYRLSREASRKVLLLEAGEKDWFPMIHIPLGFAFMMKNPRVNWCYETDPEPNMNGRKLPWPRGKVAGGTSSINGMIYIRGQREDYDHWQELGCKGWSYNDVLPYFKRAEHKAEGRNDYHGFGGPLWVEEVSKDEKFEMADIFVQSCVESGIPYNEDFNGARQEGAGNYQLNIRNGLRQNTARTYLKLCQQRPNLTIKTGALARKIIIQEGKAAGVEYNQKTRKGSAQVIHAKARKEVILCGGVINSPQLLEISGIGCSQRLKSLGIPVHQNLPGVGENLQDHLTVNIQQGVHGATTFFEETRPLALIKNLAKYFLQRKGLLTHPASQVGAFFKSSEDAVTADSQIHFTPAAGEEDSNGNLVTKPGTTATVCHLRPKSRGSVHILCTDPKIAPSIRANYLAHDDDCKAIIAAIRKVREIFSAPSMERYADKELLPGAEIQSDEALLDYVRREGESVYHPVGTCKMGHDEMAVVDDQLRVHGIESLRVADASIMPTLISGNTNAPAIMIAEKCADLILENAGEVIRFNKKPRILATGVSSEIEEPAVV